MGNCCSTSDSSQQSSSGLLLSSSEAKKLLLESIISGQSDIVQQVIIEFLSATTTNEKQFIRDPGDDEENDADADAEHHTPTEKQRGRTIGQALVRNKDTSFFEKYRHPVTGATVLHYAVASPSSEKITSLIIEYFYILEVFDTSSSSSSSRRSHLQLKESDFVNRTPTYLDRFIIRRRQSNRNASSSSSSSSSSPPPAPPASLKKLVSQATNEVNDGKFTPLHVAIQQHQPKVVRMLLEVGADANAVTASSPPPPSSSSKRKQSTSASSSSSSSCAFHPIHFACAIPNEFETEASEMLALLLEFGSDPFFNRHKKDKLLQPSGDSTYFLATTVDGNTPLHFAALAGNSLLIRGLLSVAFEQAQEQEALEDSINKNTNNKSRKPENKKKISTLTPLLQSLVNARNSKNETALLYACRSGSKLAVEALLEAGANAEICSIAPFFSPKDEVTNKRVLLTKQKLIDYDNNDKSSTSREGKRKIMTTTTTTYWSPLSAAIYSGNFELVQLLIHHLGVRPILPVHLAQKYRSLRQYALTLFQNYLVINRHNNKNRQQPEHEETSDFLNLFDNSDDDEDKNLQLVRKMIHAILPDQPLQHKLLYKNYEIVATGREIAFYNTSRVGQVNVEVLSGGERWSSPTDNAAGITLEEKEKEKEGKVEAKYEESEKQQEQEREGHTYRVLCCAFSQPFYDDDDDDDVESFFVDPKHDPPTTSTTSTYNRRKRRRRQKGEQRQLLATGGADKTICIWDAETGELKTVIKNAHASAIRALCFLNVVAHQRHQIISSSLATTPLAAKMLNDYHHDDQSPPPLLLDIPPQCLLYSGSQTLRAWNPFTGGEVGMTTTTNITDDNDDNNNHYHSDKIISLDSIYWKKQPQQQVQHQTIIGDVDAGSDYYIEKEYSLLASGSFQEIFLWQVEVMMMAVEEVSTSERRQQQQVGDSDDKIISFEQPTIITRSTRQTRIPRIDDHGAMMNSPITNTTTSSSSTLSSSILDEYLPSASPNRGYRNNYDIDNNRNDDDDEFMPSTSASPSPVKQNQQNCHHQSSVAVFSPPPPKFHPPPKTSIVNDQKQQQQQVEEIDANYYSSSSRSSYRERANAKNDDKKPVRSLYSSSSSSCSAFVNPKPILLIKIEQPAFSWVKELRFCHRNFWNSSKFNNVINAEKQKEEGKILQLLSVSDDDGRVLRSWNVDQLLSFSTGDDHDIDKASKHHQQQEQFTSLTFPQQICSLDVVARTIHQDNPNPSVSVAVGCVDGTVTLVDDPTTSVALDDASHRDKRRILRVAETIIARRRNNDKTNMSFLRQFDENKVGSSHLNTTAAAPLVAIYPSSSSFSNMSNNSTDNNNAFLVVTSCICGDQTNDSSSSSSVIQMWDGLTGKQREFTFSSSTVSSDENQHQHHHTATSDLCLPKGQIIQTMKFCSVVEKLESTNDDDDDDDDDEKNNTYQMMQSTGDYKVVLVCGMKDGSVQLLSFDVIGEPFCEPIHTQCYVTDMKLIQRRIRSLSSSSVNKKNNQKKNKKNGTELMTAAKQDNMDEEETVYLQYLDIAGRWNEMELKDLF